MNIQRMHEILGRTTIQLRKGEVLEGTPELVKQFKEGAEELSGGGVLEINLMPHETECLPQFQKVDMELLVIGVDRTEAEAHRNEIVSILNSYPDPDTLSKGPSYIHVGAEIGDQGAAFQLFALGKVLGLWDVITPSVLGLKGDDATEAAGRGFIMITGYNPA